MRAIVLCVVVVLFITSSCTSLYAQNIGDKIQVKWELLDNNFQGQRRSLTKFNIINNSKHSIPKQGWNLWFSNMRSIDVNSIQGDFTIKHINGDLYKLSPSEKFNGLGINDSIEIKMVIKNRIPNFTDAPSGLYITSDLIEPSIQAIINFIALPFSYPIEHDKKVLAELYDKNEKVKMEDESLPLSIVPSPKKLLPTGKHFTLNGNTKIIGANEFYDEIKKLKEGLLKNFGKQDSLSRDSENTIRFEKLISLGAEAYELIINEKEIVIKAATNAGAFYAIQSLLSLLPLSYFEGNQTSAKVPTLHIIDEPRLEYRGLMMDLARNFHDKKEILQVLDLMASYKLNVLHLHLNDDEGWRIEIPSIPELIEVGSKRSANFENGSTLQPSYGSGAFAKPDQFLSKEEFMEILKYADELHIQVIPEIETPGHARAAIKSMDYRAKQGLGNRISDPNDGSRYSSAQYWTDNVMDVGLSSTFEFMETVIDDLINMYEEAGLKMKIIHMGGDELPRGAWMGSPSIQQLMKEEGISSVNLVWPYYVNRILEIAKKKRIQLAGWEELGMVNQGKGMRPNPQFAAENIQLDVWNNIIGGGNEDLAYRLANMGYPVIFTSANNFYFDFAWNDTYNEPGHNWAGNIDLEKSHGFMVHNFLRNLPDHIASKKQDLTEEGKKNIIGIKGTLWSEKIKDSDRLQYMLIPRIFALAERAWAHEPEWERPSQKTWEALYDEDWKQFANRVGLNEIPRLEKRWKGINYKLPSIGIKEINGEIACNLELPGFYIVYTSDGSEPLANGTKYSHPISEKGNLKFKVFNSSGKGSYTTVYPNN
jgi:hexosaminidase